MPHARPRGERGRVERRASGGERIPWVHVGAFVAGSVLVVLFTAHQIGTERETALLHWKTHIATIAADRARLVSGWLAARRADAEVLAAFPAVRAGGPPSSWWSLTRSMPQEGEARLST